MARGGARPGAGRPRKAVAQVEPKIPKPRGGARPGAGRKKKVPAAVVVAAPVVVPAQAPVAHAPAGVKLEGAPEGWPFGVEPSSPPAPATPAEPLTPLAYLLSVVQDENADPRVRIQAASIAAPFVHVKPGDVGKKKEREASAKSVAAGSKFAAAAPPRLVSSR